LRVIGPLQEGSNIDEGGWRAHQGDERRLLLEPFVEPDKEHADELTFVDWSAEFAKLVGDRLKTLAVHADGGGALDVVAKLGVEAVDPGVDVVLEELTKSHP
jgi:hypothetical protein